MTDLGRLIGERAQAASVSGLREVGADGVNCIVEHPDHRRIYHGGRPVPGPLVLRLPEVPDGVVALIGGKTGRRFPALNDGFWDDPHGGPIELGQLLDIEDTATVEMAPPTPPIADDIAVVRRALDGAFPAIKEALRRIEAHINGGPR